MGNLAQRYLSHALELTAAVCVGVAGVGPPAGGPRVPCPTCQSAIIFMQTTAVHRCSLRCRVRVTQTLTLTLPLMTWTN